MQHVVIGTAGHIDHGKSTLVRALTGTDPDRLQEEKARGITIDLGFAHTSEDDVVLSFVDVPGHERFVRNMLAGVGGIDLAMLHVAADESVMPQTREHFDICRLLHVPAGLVVITKSDLVDADTLDVVRLEIQELVAHSFLEDAPIVPVSARTGQGLSDLRRALAQIGRQVRRRESAGAPRLPLDRVFSIRGFGTVVTGTLVAGRIRVDDELVLHPSGLAVKVRGLQVHGAPCAEAAAGQRVAVNLAGVEVGEVGRGETLVGRDRVTCTRRLDARIDLLPGARPLKHGARVRFYQGTRELSARIALAEGDELRPGEQAFARIHLEGVAVLVRGDRFIMRGSSPLTTIGGGVVLDPLPPRRGVRTRAALSRFEQLRPEPEPGARGPLLAAIEERGAAGLPSAQLVSRLGVPPDGLEAALRDLEAAGIVSVGQRLYASSVVEALERDALATIAAHHTKHPLDEGIPREELRQRLSSAAGATRSGADPGPGVAALFEVVLERLAGAGRIVVRDRVALRTHTLALTGEEVRVRDGIERILRDAGLAPPDTAVLAKTLGASLAVVERLAAMLVRQHVLVRAGDLYFHGSALVRLKDDVRSFKRGAQATMDVGTFKDRYRLTRKHAIPLLEYLDRERVTRRVGDSRVIL